MSLDPDRAKEIRKRVADTRERCSNTWRYGLWSHEGIKLANDIEYLLGLLEPTTESETA